MSDAATTTMSEPAAAPAPATQAEPAERTVYASTGGRKTVFSFVFLILAPFFLSLPFMLFMRVKHGLIGDAVGLLFIAIPFAILMFLILVELLFSIRARIELGDQQVAMTIPAGRGPTPMLRYKSYVIPYADIQAVETRREIYGGSLVPVLLKGSRIILKDGTSIRSAMSAKQISTPPSPIPRSPRRLPTARACP